MTQPIGALMLAVRESEELCDDIYETWVHDSQVCALGTRFVPFRAVLAPQIPMLSCVYAHSQINSILHTCCKS